MECRIASGQATGATHTDYDAGAAGKVKFHQRMTGLIPVTLLLIGICVLVALVSSLGENREVLSPLFISEYVGGGMREVFDGQVWRLITPIFMHFGLIHLLFNLLWLFALGGTLERVQGSRRLILLVLVVGVAGNIAQYLWAGPDFGGMSGVIYGLLAYVWIQCRRNPGCGMVLQPYIAIMMLAWFGVCWTGLIGNVANMAHSVGLTCGLLLGWTLPRRDTAPA